MATYTSENSSYASSGVGTAGLTLGVIGTALASGILGNGGFSGLLGGSSSAQQQISSLQMENAILKASNDVDTKLVSVYSELRSQDKNQDAVIAAIDKRLSAVETAAPLREQIVLGQVNSVAQSLASNVSALNTSIANNTAVLQSEIACIQKTLGGITATYVPASQVTPEPMSKYNSWTAPTTTTATTA